MGNDWQKEYRKMMEQESFSGEEKEYMVKKLLQGAAAEEANAENTAISRKDYKIIRKMKGAVAAAACLMGVLLLTRVNGVNASKLLKSVPDVFEQVFGLSGDDKELAEEMGISLSSVAVSKGIRVTADAVLADSYAYAIVFSIEREDGKPLGDAEALTPDRWDFGFFETKGASQKGGDTSWGQCYSYDENPQDASVQYVMILSCSQERKAGGNISIHLSDLYHLDDHTGGRDYIANGDWNLELTMPEPLGKVLDPGEGQTMKIGQNVFTIDKVSVSPLSYHIVFSIEAGSGQDVEDAANSLEQCVIELELKDGRKMVLEDAGYAVKKSGSCTQFVYGDIFQPLVRLEEMEAIHIGSLEIPVSL